MDAPGVHTAAQQGSPGEFDTEVSGRRRGDIAAQHYTRQRIAHWDAVAAESDRRREAWASTYHDRLAEVYRSLVSPGCRVLEIGCGPGDLLARLEPSFGLGVDFSGQMVRTAARRHPHLSFLQADALSLDLGESDSWFDVVILSDLVNDLWDVQAAFGQVRRLTRPSSRLIVNFYSKLWELALDAARSLGLARPLLEQNWLTVPDVDNLLRLADFEVTRAWDEILLPVAAGGLERFVNRYLARVWPLDIAALTHFVVARPAPGTMPANARGTDPHGPRGERRVSVTAHQSGATNASPSRIASARASGATNATASGNASTHTTRNADAGPSGSANVGAGANTSGRQDAGDHFEPDLDSPLVSVIVPARNESGNIEAIFERTPEMGRGTELVFVEGHSTDDTYAAIVRAIARHPERRARLLRQTGKGKGDAVRAGFDRAQGEVLMILDADLTVAPEDLPRFLHALRSGKGEFINGVRLVYPMQKQAMRFLNLLGNKFFSLAFSWLLGQSIKDTLCGTKVLWATDYRRIADQRAYFGDFDPFGDFDLLFGAARLNLKIVDLPIRYRERTYGTTNIQRWRHGWLLLQMVAFAARRIKFV
jgi:SAM-dependent methyltransferase